MTLFAIVEIAIGLALVFLLLGTLCSGLVEFAAQKMGLRGRYLRAGLLNLLTDRWIYLRVVNHPLLASLYRDVPGKIRHPSYIPGDTFAQALFDVVVHKAAQIRDEPPPGQVSALTTTDVREAARVCRACGFTVGEALLPLIEQAGDRLELARANVAAWYEAAMERVSGWYKLSARWRLLWVGLAVAILFNVDTVEITRDLIHNPSLRVALAGEGARVAGESNGAQAGAAVGERQSIEARGLPLGFSCLAPYRSVDLDGRDLRTMIVECWQQTKARSNTAWVLKLLGWLMTALAVSLGGPFWFDLLNRLVDLRGAGPRPEPTPAR